MQRGTANGITSLITGSSDGSIAISKQLGSFNSSGTLMDRNSNNNRNQSIQIGRLNRVVNLFSIPEANSQLTTQYGRINRAF